MAEDWEKFWEEDTFLKRVVGFMRHHYFSDVVISHLGNIKNKLILEAGCGTCESLVKISKKAKKVVGVDLSKQVLLIAKTNFQKHNIPSNKYSLVLGDIQDMKFKDNTYDLVFNAGVIEHFNDNKPIEEMIRVTKQGGKVVILVPSSYSPYYFYYVATKFLHLSNLYPWEEHTFYSFKSMRKQLDQLGINYKTKLSFRSFFVYLLVYIRK